VACCVIADQVLSGAEGGPLAEISLAGRRLAVPRDYVLDGLEPAVATAFEAALKTLSKAGMIISEVRFPHFNNFPELFAQGTIVNAEAHAHHAAHGLLEHRDQYDPMVIARIDIGGRMSGEAVQRLRDERERMMAETNRLSASHDALVLPTTPGIAPRYDEITAPADFGRHNSRALRNTSVFNFLDRCAISLPLPVEGSMPVGLMLVGETLGDQRLLMLAHPVHLQPRIKPPRSDGIVTLAKLRRLHDSKVERPGKNTHRQAPPSTQQIPHAPHFLRPHSSHSQINQGRSCECALPAHSRAKSANSNSLVHPPLYLRCST
jgi:aspartyl-tRNA(Asn)/glutamyl-tRNA(Gln) amidotransferase subunit A